MFVWDKMSSWRLHTLGGVLLVEAAAQGFTLSQDLLRQLNQY